MNRTTHLNSIRILPALAFCFVVGASTLGAQVVCGDIITTPAELTADLICDGYDAGAASPLIATMTPTLRTPTASCSPEERHWSTAAPSPTAPMALYSSPRGTTTSPISPRS